MLKQYREGVPLQYCYFQNVIALTSYTILNIGVICEKAMIFSTFLTWFPTITLLHSVQCRVWCTVYTVFFVGTLCEININDCASQPCINGTCLDLINNFTCACMPGVSGRLCEVKLNECHSQPCVNGKCITAADGFSCSCGIGKWTI